jgi:hypothetical protein
MFKATLAFAALNLLATIAIAQPSDSALLTALKRDAESGNYDPMNIENPIDAKNLKGDLAANYDPKNEFAQLGTVQILGVKLFQYQNLLDGGNGCYDFYNPQGKFLDSFCGTESSEWTWSSDD